MFFAFVKSNQSKRLILNNFFPKNKNKDAKLKKKRLKI